MTKLIKKRRFFVVCSLFLVGLLVAIFFTCKQPVEPEPEPDVKGKAPTVQDVAIMGTRSEGDVLTGQYQYNDADGDKEAVSSYSWLRADSADGEYVPIETATLTEYTLSVADGAKYLKFEVTPMSDVAPVSGEAVLSEAFGPIEVPPTVTDVTLSGLVKEDETITIDYTFADVNGDDEAGTTFQWYRCDVKDGEYTAIDGAEAFSYIIMDADLDKYLKIVITPLSHTEPAIGIPTSYVVGPIKRLLPPMALNVKIAGVFSEGETITGEYDFYDIDGDSEGETEFQWLRCGDDRIYEVVGNNLEYTLTEADRGQFIKFEVTPIAGAEPTTGKSVISMRIGPFTAMPNASSVEIVDGLIKEGETVTGSYQFDDFEGDPEGESTYRWLICDTSDGVFVPIDGVTTTNYTFTNADADRYIKFEVTPISSAEPSLGHVAWSAVYGHIERLVPPTAVVENITGIVKEGEGCS